jgi:hypothetical protein
MNLNRAPQDKLYAIISVDQKGNEGLVALNTPHMGPQLAVTGDTKILKYYKEIVRSGFVESKAAGMVIKVAEFTRTQTSDL